MFLEICCETFPMNCLLEFPFFHVDPGLHPHGSQIGTARSLGLMCPCLPSTRPHDFQWHFSITHDQHLQEKEKGKKCNGGQSLLIQFYTETMFKSKEQRSNGQRVLLRWDAIFKPTKFTQMLLVKHTGFVGLKCHATEQFKVDKHGPSSHFLTLKKHSTFNC